MTKVFAGVDAGGTKTRCILMDVSRHVLSSSTAGPGNWRAYGSIASGNILKAIEAAIESNGREKSDLSAICLGGAGSGTQGARDELFRVLLETYPLAKIKVEHDAAIALSGASASGTGIIVISGTGAMAYGRNSSGETARADGWGYKLGDEGSSYWIGLSGIKAALKESDGRLPESGLKKAVFDAMGAMEPQDVIETVYDEDFRPENIARLAILVNSLAESGNAPASTIMDQAGRLLAQSAAAVAHRLNWDEQADRLRIFTAGGTFAFKGILIEAFDKELDRLVPGALRASPKYAPVVGAALMALEMYYGRRPDRGRIDIGDKSV